jgi:hypothetical protein
MSGYRAGELKDKAVGLIIDEIALIAKGRKVDIYIKAHILSS